MDKKFMEGKSKKIGDRERRRGRRQEGRQRERQKERKTERDREIKGQWVKENKKYTYISIK